MSCKEVATFWLDMTAPISLLLLWHATALRSVARRVKSGRWLRIRSTAAHDRRKMAPLPYSRDSARQTWRCTHDERSNSRNEQAGVGRSRDDRCRRRPRVLFDPLRMEHRGQSGPAIRRLWTGDARRQGRGGHRPDD